MAEPLSAWWPGGRTIAAPLAASPLQRCASLVPSLCRHPYNCCASLPTYTEDVCMLKQVMPRSVKPQVIELKPCAAQSLEYEDLLLACQNQGGTHGSHRCKAWVWLAELRSGKPGMAFP